MPRRDVVLTGILAFGAGVAVGANWKKLGKKAAPLLEQLGLKMSDLADFLAEVTEDAKAEPKPAKVPRARSSKKKTQASVGKQTEFSSPSHRNGKNGHVSAIRPLPKRKIVRPTPVILAEPLSK
jgi:hypothetical protein